MSVNDFDQSDDSANEALYTFEPPDCPRYPTTRASPLERAQQRFEVQGNTIGQTILHCYCALIEARIH